MLISRTQITFFLRGDLSTEAYDSFYGRDTHESSGSEVIVFSARPLVKGERKANTNGSLNTPRLKKSAGNLWSLRTREASVANSSASQRCLGMTISNSI